MGFIPSGTMQAFQNVKPAYQRIYLTLKAALQEDGLDLTGKIPEEALAREFGTSRTPLRRAMETLRKEGLVNPRPHVPEDEKPLSKREIKNLVEFDAVLEAFGAYLAAQGGLSADELQLLRELNQKLSNPDPSVEFYSRHEVGIMGLRDTHLQFHLLVAKFSRNNYLYEAVVNARRMMRRYSTRSKPLTESPFQAYRYIFGTTHEVILNAIEAGDPMTAMTAMYMDVCRTKAAYLDSYINPYSTTPAAD